MPLTREERKLLHQKSKQPTFGSGKPDNKQGNEGDISFRQVEGSGTVEYVKTNGEWVAVASSGEMPAVRIIGSSGGGGTSGTGTFSGSYVATITGGDGIDSTGSTSGSNINHTLSLDLSELNGAAMTTSDSIAFIDADDSNNSKKESIADVVTLLAGDGIMNSSNVFAVDVSDFAGTGLEDDGSENLRLSTQGTGISGGNGSTLSITPAQTAITSVYNTSLVIGRAADDTTINFGVDDVIVFDSGADEKLRIDSGGADVTGALTTTTTAAIGTNATFGTSTAAGNMNALLSSAQDTFFGNLLDGSDDIFDFGGANGDGGTTLIDSDGFTASNATFVRVIGPNYGHLENTSSAQGYVSLPLTTVSGKVYECTFDVIAGATSDIEVCLSSSTSWNTAAESGIRSANTGHSLVHNYIADDTSSYLIIRLASSTSGHAGRITNIVVRQAVFFSDGEISSGSYVSGFAGSGWKIDKDATATNEYDLTVDNMFIRGRLSVYELLIQQIRATNGAIFVTSSAKVLSTSSLSASDSGGDITFEDPSGHGICPFLANDLIMMQRVVPGSLVAGSSTAGSTNVIKKLVYKVSSVSGATATVIAATGFNNNDFPVKGDDFVRIGNTGTASRQGTIYLTSDDSNAPYMDVKDNIDSYGDWHDASTTKVRVGNLSGITDAGLNAGSSLSGYGLYGGNVFLKGAINAKSGHIGADASGDNGWKIEESKIYNDAESSYLNVDGVNDYLALGSTDASSDIAITSSTGISIAFWIYFPTSNVTEIIMASHDNNSNYAGWWIQKDSTNTFSFHWGKGSGGTGAASRESRVSSTNIMTNTWYFVAITSTFAHSTATGTNIYINRLTPDDLTISGTANVSTPGYSPSGGSTGKIGGEIFGASDTFGEFKMKNIAVWNVILDTNDLTSLYNSGNYISWASNTGTYDKASNLKMHIDFTTGSENDLTTNISDSDTVLTNGASIINANTSFIGLVQENASAIASNEAGSSFYAGATANTGANASISFGTDGKLRGNGIYVKDGIEYLITASRIFGNGSDGPLTLNNDSMSEDENDLGEDLGSNWITGGALQRDIYATNLTINAGINIKTNGYRIFVRDTLHLAGSGASLFNTGSNGNDGSAGAVDSGGGAGGTGAGAGAPSGSLLGGITGGVGGAGGAGDTGSGSASGAAGVDVATQTNCIRVYTTNDGAAGATGQAGSGSGSSGQSGTTRSANTSSDGNISITNADLTYIIAMRDFFTIDGSAASLHPAAGAVGGGGGGGGGRTGSGTNGNGGGGGGQAGGSGGHVMLVARQITGTLTNLSLEAKGGAGGDGGNGATNLGGGDGGAGAGGNGGDGGCIVLITGTNPKTSGVDGIVRDVSGGAAGNNSTTGATASIEDPQVGKTGTVITCHV